MLHVTERGQRCLKRVHTDTQVEATVLLPKSRGSLAFYNEGAVSRCPSLAFPCETSEPWGLGATRSVLTW